MTHWREGSTDKELVKETACVSLHLASHKKGGTLIRVLRRMLEPNKKELVGGWSRPHNEQPHNL
jgi:hypothetical protein